MREEIEVKLDNLIDLLDKDSRIIDITNLKSKLVNNKELIDKIDKLNNLDKYSNEYKELKKELFTNSDFVSFKELETEINYLILEINSKLKELTNERRCNHESN